MLHLQAHSSDVQFPEARKTQMITNSYKHHPEVTSLRLGWLGAGLMSFRCKQGWVMRPFAQTNARTIRAICVFYVNASAFRGHF